MNKIALIAFVLVCGGPVPGQLSLNDPIPTRSVSGQFLASSMRAVAPSRFANNNSISTDPGLLVISCERIKQSLYRQLGEPSVWQGTIHLHVHSARIAYEQPVILIERGLRGWAYRVELPDSMDQAGFVRTMVEALLLELANRQANGHPSEIPMWLSEGLSQEVLLSDAATFSLPSHMRRESGLQLVRVDVSERRTNAVDLAKIILGDRIPMTFEQLSWPVDDRLFSANGVLFRCSALLFVEELLQLKDGQACLRTMMADLPRRYNWQFAFLNGFAPHFNNLLAVEKWWALQLVNFTGRDPGQFWTLAESWKQLDAALRARVEVRQRASDLPMRTDLTLQAIIRDRDVVQQQQLLQRKLQELDLARLRVAPELVSLVQDYREVVQTYLREQKPATSFFTSFFLFRKRAEASANRLADATLQQLDALDARREALRAATSKPAAESGTVTAR